MPFRAAARSAAADPDCRRAPSSLPHLLALLLQLLLELLDRAMDQDLGGPVGPSQGACDLPVVHAKCEAHDQCLTSVLGQRAHALQYCNSVSLPTTRSSVSW